MPGREAMKLHRALVADANLFVPRLTEEVWDWLNLNVTHPFRVVSVNDGGMFEDDHIVFTDYQEFLHFKLRWGDDFA